MFSTGNACICYRAGLVLLLLDEGCGDDDLLPFDGTFRQPEIRHRRSVDRHHKRLHHHRFVPDEGGAQPVWSRGDVEDVVLAGHIRHGAEICPDDHDIHCDQGLAGFPVDDFAGNFPCCLGNTL
jgi:hypothetical protein